MRLDRLASADIVNELVRTLGHDRTIDILEVGLSRLKALAGERGCLTAAQLQRISEQTGRSWPRWGVEGGARHAKTPEAMAFVQRARQMWDEIDGKSEPRRVRQPSRKIKTSPLRRAV